MTDTLSCWYSVIWSVSTVQTAAGADLRSAAAKKNNINTQKESALTNAHIITAPVHSVLYYVGEGGGNNTIEPYGTLWKSQLPALNRWKRKKPLCKGSAEKPTQNNISSLHSSQHQAASPLRLFIPSYMQTFLWRAVYKPAVRTCIMIINVSEYRKGNLRNGYVLV